MAFDWDSHCQLWMDAQLDVRRNQLAADAALALAGGQGEDGGWLVRALEERSPEYTPKLRFVVSVLGCARALPRDLLVPILHAAVLEPDPSFNRYFIEPCVRCFGPRVVNERLITRYMEQGSDDEKAGVAWAFYWSFMRFDDANPEVDIDDLRARARHWRLTEFVHNENLAVRRAIVPGLELDPMRYPEPMRPLLGDAVRIARAHSDEYIRRRIEIQLVSLVRVPPLPTRLPGA